MTYIFEKNSKNYEQMGGKATALSKMGNVIHNIPDWFGVSYTGFHTEKKEILEEAKNEIQMKLKDFPEDEYFAVRSSAGNEDSSENSFAGQFETFLYVKKENVLEKVREVYMSAFADRVDVYRKENQIEEIMVPSVIVQKMVKFQFVKHPKYGKKLKMDKLQKLIPV